MARYLFEGTTPLILAGLHEGSTAWLEPADGRPVAPGVPVIHPGDRVRTLHPYPHGLFIRIPDVTDGIDALIAARDGALAEQTDAEPAATDAAPEPPAPKRARAPKTAPTEE